MATETANLTSAESAVGGTRGVQSRGGGSIPASALFFHAGDSAEAAALVERYHYSRRMPSNIQVIGAVHLAGGLFGTRGDCVGACIFTIPPTRWSEPVWELARLVKRGDERLPLSFLIRLTVAQVRKTGLCDLLVSFADQTQGHHGGIYQAAGWHYDGKRNASVDGLIIDGEFKPGRSCNSAFGTRSATKLMAERGIVAEPHYDEGKHLYWRALNKAGEAKAGRLGLRNRTYPKPKLAAA
jgi:hypothetical protein